MIRISTHKSYGTKGISIFSLLTIAFVILRLLGYIDWSWWWVLSPLWITFTLAFLVLFTVTYISIKAEQLKDE